MRFSSLEHSVQPPEYRCLARLLAGEKIRYLISLGSTKARLYPTTLSFFASHSMVLPWR